MVPGAWAVRTGFMKVEDKKTKESDGGGSGPGRQGEQKTELGLSIKGGFILHLPHTSRRGVNSTSSSTLQSMAPFISTHFY